MKVVSCNVCKKEITDGKLGAEPVWPSELRVSCKLDPHAHSDMVGATKPFLAVIQVETFQFNCTGFDVCQKCVVDAIKRQLNADYPNA